MSNIEEDIKRLKAFNPGDEYTEKIKTAIQNILEERKQDKKRIKELEEENKLLLSSKVGIDLSYDDYIPKQKVKEVILKVINYKIPRAVNNGYYYDYFVNQEYKEVFVKLFNKLLEDK